MLVGLFLERFFHPVIGISSYLDSLLRFPKTSVSDGKPLQISCWESMYIRHHWEHSWYIRSRWALSKFTQQAPIWPDTMPATGSWRLCQFSPPSIVLTIWTNFLYSVQTQCLLLDRLWSIMTDEKAVRGGLSVALNPQTNPAVERMLFRRSARSWYKTM